MDDSREVVPEASAAAASSPDVNVLEITAQADDAILGPVPVKKDAEDSARRVPPLFERLLSYGPHAVLAACLFGLAWAAGSYFSGAQSPFYAMKPQPIQTIELQDSEMLRTVQKMAEEIRALKANVEAMHAAQSLSAKDASGREDLKTRLGAVRTETDAAIAELAGKVLQLQRDSAAKLSQVGERFDRIELQIAAQRAATSVADASAPGGAAPRKRAQGGRGDAFDPFQNPNAPGAPRPLGSLAPAAPLHPPGISQVSGEP